MTNKFWYLTSVSLNKKIKSKWFIIANILLLILIVGLLNIDGIISFFGGDFDKPNEIIVIDHTNNSFDIFNKNMTLIKEKLDFDFKDKIIKSNKKLDDLKKNLKEDNKIIIVLDSNDNSYLYAKIISNNYIDTVYYQYLNQVLTATKVEVGMMKSDIDHNEFVKLTSPIEIDRQILSEEKSVDDMMNTLMSTVFPTVILPVFMLVIFLVQMIGNEIFEEKSTRSMEIIISNVSPKIHFYSKILSGNIFVLSQSLLLIIYSVIGFFIRSLTGNNISTNKIGELLNQVTEVVTSNGLVDKLYYIIPLALIILILSFITYSLIAGILASMTVNMEDYQQIQMPIVIISLVAYYLSIMAPLFKGSIFIKILSYIPLFSALLSPALLVIGDINILDMLISILLLIITNHILIKKGMKVYKAGILNYSTDKMWKKIFKSL